MAKRDCKICKGTGIKWFVCGYEEHYGQKTAEYDKDICDCYMEDEQNGNNKRA